MKKIDLAYTAGIIDGEGCIHISRQWDKRYRGCYKYGLMIKVESTDEWLCKWLHFAWGGSIHWTKKNNPKWRPSWEWQLSNRQACQFLKTILPYLRIKRPQAEIAIEFQTRQRVGGRRTPEEQVLKEANRILLQTMKRN